MPSASWLSPALGLITLVTRVEETPPGEPWEPDQTTAGGTGTAAMEPEELMVAKSGGAVDGRDGPTPAWLVG